MNAARSLLAAAAKKRVGAGGNTLATTPKIRQQYPTRRTSSTTTVDTGYIILPALVDNLLVVTLAGDKNTGTITVSDNVSGTTGWSKVVEVAGASVSSYMAWKVAVGGELEVTLTTSAAPVNGSTGNVFEISQVGTGSWGVVASSVPAYSDTAVSSRSTGTTGTASSNGLAIAMANVDTLVSVNTAGDSWTNSYSAIDPVDSISNTGTGANFIATASVSSGATTETTFSYTGGTADQIYGAVVVFGRSFNGTNGGPSGGVPTISLPDAAGNPAGLTYGGTLTISTNGTYDGNSIGHYAKVIVNSGITCTIQNMAIKGPPELISLGSGSNVTVKHCYLEGTSGRTSSNRAVAGNAIGSLVVEFCKFSNVAGVKVIGSSPTQLNIRYNKFRNVIGSTSDYVQAIQFDTVDTSLCEISWNEIYNIAGSSSTEDSISFYKCGGPDSANRWLVHNNLVWGAFPYDYTVDTGYSGGGIMHNDYSTNTQGHFETYYNVVLGTTNYGLSCVGGTDAYIHNNVVIGSGTTQDGTNINASQGGGPNGIVLWFPSWQPAGTPTNNKMQKNLTGWWRSVAANRNDAWWDSTGQPAASGNDMSNIISYKPGQQLFWQDERDFYEKWYEAKESAAVSIGPNW